MPPRYAYWTILVDDQPTAFRAGAQEDLQPTYNRLKLKNPSARMVWFQNGKIWDSRLDAQEAMRARGEMGRRGDSRQGGSDFRDPSTRTGLRDSKTATRSEQADQRDSSGKLEWKAKSESNPGFRIPDSGSRREKPEWRPKTQDQRPRTAGRADWQPKGSFKPDRPAQPGWKPKGQDSRPRTTGRPDWKPKGSFKSDRPARSDWKPNPGRSEKPEWKPQNSRSAKREGGSDWKSRTQDPRPRTSEKLDWKPKGSAAPAAREKRKWVPKEEYKKSQGIEAKRDKNWRPGGAHKDPRQKYKDAKKAKWGRFKQTIRRRSEKKPGRKKKDDE